MENNQAPQESSTQPTHSEDIGPREVFLQLLAIVTLYLSAVAFGTILFQLINIGIPDPLDNIWQVDSRRASMRWGVAALIVVFPVYAWVSWYLKRAIRILPIRSEMKSRKWLLNFTLFATAVAIIIDLITLVLRYLEGDLSMRFVMKVLVVFFIAGAIFTYYLWDLKTKGQGRDKRMRMFVYVIGGIVLLSVIAGFVMAGTPQSERLRRFDERRVNDLSEIQWQVLSYWQQKDTLPQSLAELSDSLSGYRVSNDPETGDVYIYQVTGDLSFELCATFSAESVPGTYPETYPRVPVPGMGDAENFDTWSHPAGGHCFERTIDPERYGVDEKPLR